MLKQDKLKNKTFGETLEAEAEAETQTVKDDATPRPLCDRCGKAVYGAHEPIDDDEQTWLACHCEPKA